VVGQVTALRFFFVRTLKRRFPPDSIPYPKYNHRLTAFDGERVTFRWKDYTHRGKQRTMMLQATESLRRFFLHVLPKGFVRIRHFGFLGNRFGTRLLSLARLLLPSVPNQEHEPESGAPSTWHCPRCGTPMIVVERFSAVELRCAFFDSS
jgi:hypothetical protein